MDETAFTRDAHLLRDFGALALLLVLRIDRLLLLLHQFRLHRANIRVWAPTHKAEAPTFSIANSSSALTRISRAFSIASCLMNATYPQLLSAW